MRSKVLVAVVVVVMLLAYLWRKHTPEGTRSEQPRTTSVAVASGAPPEPEVRRLASAERKQLGEQIHAAIKKAKSNTAASNTGGHPDRGSAPSLDEEPLLSLEEIGPSLKAALDQSIPEFAKCYEGKTAANKTPIAIMEMVSDPDLGTVIDTVQMIDADGKPLPPDIDDCLRETADSLSLPPLGKPGRLPVQYSFRFH